MAKKVLFESGGAVITEGMKLLRVRLAGKSRKNDFVTEEGLHTCQALEYENERRVQDGENAIYLFQDLENCMWNMRVGLEFVEMKYCPYCSEELC